MRPATKQRRASAKGAMRRLRQSSSGAPAGIGTLVAGHGSDLHQSDSY